MQVPNCNHMHSRIPTYIQRILVWARVCREALSLVLLYLPDSKSMYLESLLLHLMCKSVNHIRHVDWHYYLAPPPGPYSRGDELAPAEGQAEVPAITSRHVHIQLQLQPNETQDEARRALPPITAGSSTTWHRASMYTTAKATGDPVTNLSRKGFPAKNGRREPLAIWSGGSHTQIDQRKKLWPSYHGDWGKGEWGGLGVPDPYPGGTSPAKLNHGLG